MLDTVVFCLALSQLLHIVSYRLPAVFVAVKDYFIQNAAPLFIFMIA